MPILDRRSAGIALFVLVAACALAACGRKGGLEPPPSAAIPPGQHAAAPSTPGEREGGEFLLPSAPEPEQAGAAPPPGPAAKRPFFLDWLLN